MSACVFPGGLAMVVLAGAELFTGNSLLVIPLLSRKVRFSGVLRSWAVVYLGNLIGALAVAALAVYSHQLGQFSGALAASAMSTAAAKCSLTFGDAFLRGMACNFLVCIAVWITMSATSVIGKVSGLYFPILLFVVSGFDSVANMYYIPVALFAKGVPAYVQGGGRGRRGRERPDLGGVSGRQSAASDAGQPGRRSPRGHRLLVLLPEG